MYGQILTHRDGRKAKIIDITNKIISIGVVNIYNVVDLYKFKKEDLIKLGWIFPAKKWTPELNDKYYVPDLTDKDKHNCVTWKNDEDDRYYLANNLVYSTPEKAIALTNKMLGAVRV